MAVDKLIIYEALPYRLVDSPYCKALVQLGLPDHLTVSCRQTVSKRLGDHFDTMMSNLVGKFEKVDYLATTADGWSKLRRGFLGMTGHWIDPDTMERQSAALAVRRRKGRHAFDRLAQEINNVHKDFKIQGKVTKCTTDSAANFGKAFRMFATNSKELDKDKGGKKKTKFVQIQKKNNSFPVRLTYKG